MSGVERRHEVHSQQKAAWFELIVIGGTLVLYGAAVPALSWWFHRPLAQTALPALGIFGLSGLTGFETLFYRSPRDPARRTQPVMDERDWQLSRRAWTAGMISFWLFFYIAGIGTWAYLYFLRGLEWVTVPIALFPGMIFAGFAIFMLARSLTILHFYGWRVSDAG
jgi:hypothetical protein